MKCTSTIVFAMAAIAMTSVDAAYKVFTTNTGERMLGAFSSNTKQTDGGPMSKATTDSKPQVSNGGVNFYPYSNDIKNYIVAAHNKARAQLVPTEAANMRQISWDESLAIEAAELVNTCVFEHDTENYAYGQNLMYGGRTLSTSVVDSWMDAWVSQEISASDRAGNGYMDLDHASAVLWATSYLVGCASKMCPNGYLTACNYYTPGNWVGERTYIPGRACSQCPSQAPYCDATYGKLCTATPPSQPQPQPTPAPTNGPAPTPAKTTGAPVTVPTPAPTNGSPDQQDQDQSQPTPAPTNSDDEGNNSGSTKTPNPAVQRPIDDASTETPTTSPKWSNVEESPATKPLVSHAIAAVCGLLLIARAM